MDLSKVEKLITSVLESEGLELVDMEYLREKGRWTLRVYIDKDGGVNLQDCEYWSERIGASLDCTDLMEHAYSLEVSSPGIDRVIRKDKDLIRFAGRLVRATLSAPVEGRRRLNGKLQGLEDGAVLIEAEGRVWRLPRREVAEMRLDGDAEARVLLKRASAKDSDRKADRRRGG